MRCGSILDKNRLLSRIVIATLKWKMNNEKWKILACSIKSGTSKGSAIKQMMLYNVVKVVLK